jgi:hypothetical protein
VEATQAHITVDTESKDITALGGTDTALATAGMTSDIPGGFSCRFQFRVVTELPGSLVQIGRESSNRGRRQSWFSTDGKPKVDKLKDVGLTGRIVTRDTYNFGRCDVP